MPFYDWPRAADDAASVVGRRCTDRGALAPSPTTVHDHRHGLGPAGPPPPHSLGGGGGATPPCLYFLGRQSNQRGVGRPTAFSNGACGFLSEI